MYTLGWCQSCVGDESMVTCNWYCRDWIAFKYFPLGFWFLYQGVNTMGEFHGLHTSVEAMDDYVKFLPLHIGSIRITKRAYSPAW